MSQALLDELGKLLRQSQALPQQVASFQAEVGRARQESEKLGNQADVLQAELQSHQRTLENAREQAQQRLDAQQAELSQAAGRMQQALLGLSRVYEASSQELQVGLQIVGERASQLEQGVEQAQTALREAGQRQAEATEHGLQALQSSWSRLEATLEKASHTARGWAESGTEAESAARGQFGQLAEHLQTTRSALATDLSALQNEARQIEQRFQARLLQTQEEAVVANAQLAERNTEEDLEQRVNLVSSQRVEKYRAQGVEFMGQLSTRSEDMMVPVRQQLERHLKSYQRGQRLKPMLLAVYNYLQRFGQDLPESHLLFSGGGADV